MRKDYLADAMNEISSKYIEEAAKIKKRKISWKHWVEVTDCFRGDLAKGDIYNVLADAPSSVTGMIDDLKIGDEAIFMSTTVTEETGISMNGGFFCYADLAELYLSEGYRFLFIGSNDGVQYAKDVYDITAADGETTLGDVAEYIRGMIE